MWRSRMNGAAMDLCMRLGPDALNRIAASILSRVTIEPQQVLGGELRFGTPQLVMVFCPNNLQFDIGFSFAGFISATGTARLLAQATAMPLNGGMRICLRNFTVDRLTISPPGLESVATPLVAQLLPAEICVNM